MVAFIIIKLCVHLYKARAAYIRNSMYRIIIWMIDRRSLKMLHTNCKSAQCYLLAMLC